MIIYFYKYLYFLTQKLKLTTPTTLHVSHSHESKSTEVLLLQIIILSTALLLSHLTGLATYSCYPHQQSHKWLRDNRYNLKWSVQKQMEQTKTKAQSEPDTSSKSGVSFQCARAKWPIFTAHTHSHTYQYPWGNLRRARNGNWTVSGRSIIERRVPVTGHGSFSIVHWKRWCRLIFIELYRSNNNKFDLSILRYGKAVSGSARPDSSRANAFPAQANGTVLRPLSVGLAGTMADSER